MATGAPGIPDVQVKLYSKASGSWSGVATTTTDADGEYVLADVTPGTYHVGFHPTSDHLVKYYDNWGDVENAENVIVGDGQAVTNISVTIARGAHITGVVVGANSPLAGIEVSAYRYSWSAGWTAVANDLTDAGGAYDIGPLSSGPYRLGFLDPSGTYRGEFWQNAATVGTATEFNLQRGERSTGKNAFLAAVATTPAPTPPPAPAPGPAPVPAPAPAPTPVSAAAALSEMVAGIDVAGKPKVGKTLKLTSLQKSLRGAVSYKIQWYAAKKAIKQATKPTLKVIAAMRGKVISVKVTATSGGVSKTRRIKVGKVA